jgi:hypothetical protein
MGKSPIGSGLAACLGRATTRQMPTFGRKKIMPAGQGATGDAAPTAPESAATAELRTSRQLTIAPTDTTLQRESL